MPKRQNNRQLHHTLAIGDGDCLFHSFSANIIYNIFKANPAPLFMQNVQSNLLPELRKMAKRLGIALPQPDDLQEVFIALMMAYPMPGTTPTRDNCIDNCNFAALSCQVMVPALRAMLSTHVDDEDVKAIAAPILRHCIVAERGRVAALQRLPADADPAVQALYRISEFDKNFLPLCVPSVPFEDQYQQYWQIHNCMGIDAGPIEQKAMSRLLGANDYLVRTYDAALSLDGDRYDQGADFYLRKVPGHFTAHVGSHPDHGKISDSDNRLAVAISEQFSLTHGAEKEARNVFKAQSPITSSVVAPPRRSRSCEFFSRDAKETVKNILSHLDPSLEENEAQKSDIATVLAMFSSQKTFELRKMKNKLNDLIASYQDAALDTLREKESLSDDEKQQLIAGDERYAMRLQLEEIKKYVDTEALSSAGRRYLGCA